MTSGWDALAFAYPRRPNPKTRRHGTVGAHPCATRSDRCAALCVVRAEGAGPLSTCAGRRRCDRSHQRAPCRGLCLFIGRPTFAPAVPLVHARYERRRRRRRCPVLFRDCRCAAAPAAPLRWPYRPSLQLPFAPPPPRAPVVCPCRTRAGVRACPPRGIPPCPLYPTRFNPLAGPVFFFFFCVASHAPRTRSFSSPHPVPALLLVPSRFAPD